ncbi:hypothetical protein LCGC14_2472920 [marine sediment metagenome]|uniref:Uncharacterized protein n=1 Tax=marine sediment metagenome TaxID=412755 RepID=A0A0F9E3T6_9ZZZZ
MPGHTEKERSKGRVQSSDKVANPMPAKKTSVKRRGKRGK